MSRDHLITHDEIKRLKFKNNSSDSTSVENLIDDSSTILFHKQVGETCPTLESKEYGFNLSIQFPERPI